MGILPHFQSFFGLGIIGCKLISVVVIILRRNLFLAVCPQNIWDKNRHLLKDTFPTRGY